MAAGMLPTTPDTDLQPEDLVIHGYPSEHDWPLAEATEASLTIAIDFPEGNAIGRLIRTARAVPAAPAVMLETTVEACKRCRHSLAFHPSFVLSDEAGSFEIVPDGYEFGLVHPQNTRRRLSALTVSFAAPLFRTIFLDS